MLAIQSGEPGPIAQVIAGVDLAVWDLCARRAGQPLWRLLGGGERPDRRLRERHQPGPAGRHRRGRARERPSRLQAEGRLRRRARPGQRRGGARAARRRAAPDARRQPGLERRRGRDRLARPASSRSRSAGSRSRCAPTGRPPNGSACASATPIPLAAGENLLGEAAFAAAIDGGCARRRPARQRQVGRHLGRLAGDRAHPRRRPASTARTTSAPASACSPRRTCSPRAGGDGLLEIDANPEPAAQHPQRRARGDRRGPVAPGRRAGHRRRRRSRRAALALRRLSRRQGRARRLLYRGIAFRPAMRRIPALPPTAPCRGRRRERPTCEATAAARPTDPRGKCTWRAVASGAPARRRPERASLRLRPAPSDRNSPC